MPLVGCLAFILDYSAMNSETEQYCLTQLHVLQDLYRLLAYFYASKPLNDLCVQEEDQCGTVSALRARCEKAEIHRLLIKDAATFRVQQDQCAGLSNSLDAENSCPNEDNCGTLMKDVCKPHEIIALSLREACNKIIHADTLEHSNNCEEDNCEEDNSGLEPNIKLSGRFCGKDWETELDILKFVDCLHHNFQLEQ